MTILSRHLRYRAHHRGALCVWIVILSEQQPEIPMPSRAQRALDVADMAVAVVVLPPPPPERNRGADAQRAAQRAVLQCEACAVTPSPRRFLQWNCRMSINAWESVL